MEGAVRVLGGSPKAPGNRGPLDAPSARNGAVPGGQVELLLPDVAASPLLGAVFAPPPVLLVPLSSRL
jgi:hypothetical protein